MSSSGVHMFVSRQIVGSSSAPGGLNTGSGSAKRAPTVEATLLHHFIELGRQRVAARKLFSERVVEPEHDDRRVWGRAAQVGEDRAEVRANVCKQSRRFFDDAFRFSFAGVLDHAERVVRADVERDRIAVPGCAFR